MAWTYQQSSGKLTDPSGAMIGIGYSGLGPGLNKPALEASRGVGPIPAGHWRIHPPLDPPDHLGPIAMPLTPVDFDPHGRSAFFMHGDNAAMDFTASDGCIIMSHAIRAAVDASPDSDLTVIA